MCKYDKFHLVSGTILNFKAFIYWLKYVFPIIITLNRDLTTDYIQDLLLDEQHDILSFYFNVHGIVDGQQVEAICGDLFHYGFYLPLFDVLF